MAHVRALDEPAQPVQLLAHGDARLLLEDDEREKGGVDRVRLLVVVGEEGEGKVEG